MPVTPPSNPVPIGVCLIDPTSGIAYSSGCANYTTVTTAGTTTIDSMPGGGIFYGLYCLATGTTWTALALDYYVTGTTTNTGTMIATQTAAALGFQANPGPGGTGVRYNGNLVVVTSGTPGSWNVLWD
jgi:hypothetical protein